MMGSNLCGVDGYVVTFRGGFIFYGGSDEEGFPYVVKVALGKD